MPVDLYVGGVEHAVLHLLYSRFWHHVLYDLGLVSTKEPFKKLFNQGMIQGEDGQKMSKSRGNVINPDDVVKNTELIVFVYMKCLWALLRNQNLGKPRDYKDVIGFCRRYGVFS